MSLEPLLLVGPGGHALSCIDVIELEGRFQVKGLVGQTDDLGRNLFGYEVVGTDEQLPALLADTPNALITVGQIERSAVRRELYQRVFEAGGNLPVIVSPRAYVSPHAQIGNGTIVMHGAVINAGARIGSNCIINTLALLEHGCEIGDHCHISTTAVLNGDVKVGSGTFVGSASSIRHGVTIGDDCVIGMGQIVVKNCADGTRLPTPGKSP